MSTRPLRDRPSRRNRDSADECCRSGPSSASGSRKTLTASSNETPCFTALASAFRGSHSNTYLVYTKCPARVDRAARTRAHGLVRRNCESVLCQNCVTYTPKPWVNTMIYGTPRRTSVLREVIDGKRVGGIWCASARAAGVNFQACSFNHSDISPSSNEQ